MPYCDPLEGRNPQSEPQVLSTFCLGEFSGPQHREDESKETIEVLISFGVRDLSLDSLKCLEFVQWREGSSAMMSAKACLWSLVRAGLYKGSTKLIEV